jgi:hemerythrin superfamily protein
VKASRYVTQVMRLLKPASSVRLFLRRCRILSDKLGPILFQLPPRWHLDLARLEAFLAVLPRGRRFVFEFRDPSWLVPPVMRLLERHGAGFCAYELARYRSPVVATAGFAYARLHGPDAPYSGRYGPDALDRWAERAAAWSAEGRDVFVYFDNTAEGEAARNAAELRDLLRPDGLVQRTHFAAREGMDALELLKKDHDRVKDLFSQFQDPRQAGHRRSLFNAIRSELELHTHIDETVFYPAFGKYPDFRPILDRSYADHKQFTELLGSLGTFDEKDSRFEGQVAHLIREVTRHIQEEEDELFPMIRKVTRRPEREQLGRHLDAAKRERQVA